MLNYFSNYMMKKSTNKTRSAVLNGVLFVACFVWFTFYLHLILVYPQ